jgi:hypothetical protein
VRYRVVYSVPTPDGRQSIVADVYPYAMPRAVTYMKPAQPFYGAMQTQGGWYVARPGLRRTLVQAGLPAAAPTDGGSHVWRRLGMSVVALAVLAAAAALLRLKRRPQSRPAAAS